MNVAALVAPLFEDSELIYPYYRLQEAGHAVKLVGSERATYRGKHGVEMEADIAAREAEADDFDAIVIPGGYSPDHMRRDPDLVALVSAIGRAGKPIAAICHGPWMLASAGLLDGKNVTSFFSIKDDLVNAGAGWVDNECVVDGNFVTSRSPSDLPAFMRSLLELLQK